MIRSIPFQRAKYGRPLLVDVAAVGSLRGFIQSSEPHALTFMEVMLVTGGSGELSLDGKGLEVTPGAVFVTTSGQVRSWRLRAPLQATVGFFETGFAGIEMPSGALALPDGRFGESLSLLERMIDDLAGARDDTLWPSLQHLLGLLGPSRPAPILARRFSRLVDRHFRERQRVLDYARLLDVTPEYLSRSIRAHTGRMPSDIIHQRILLEARRWLVYTDESVSAIAEALRFNDASWFNKFFQRGAGVTPGSYRAASRA